MGKNDDASLVKLGRKPRLKAETGVNELYKFQKSAYLAQEMMRKLIRVPSTLLTEAP